MLGGLGGQAWMGSVMRVWVAYRGLRARGSSARAARGAILRGGFMVSNRLEETDRRTLSQHTPSLFSAGADQVVYQLKSSKI